MKMGNAKCKSKARLEGKIVVITGCNSGIGKECVKEFYLRGAHIIMACRNLEKARSAQVEIEEAFKGTANLGIITTVKLDLSSLQSVRTCAAEINASVEKIDILLNNAGIMACPYQKTEDKCEMQLCVNYLGHFLLTLLLSSKIIASDSEPARIINVSSMAHFGGSINFHDLNWNKRRYSATFAYCQSKLALIMFTKELARRFRDAGILNVHTYCLHPGFVRTGLWRYVENVFFRGCINLLFVLTPFFKTEKEGAQTSIYCSVSDECAKQTGLYYQQCHTAWCKWNAKNKDDARRLWVKSLELTGLDVNFNLNNFVH